MFFFSYFSYHIISGERGVIKMLYLKKEIESSQKILSQKKSEKNKLEDNVKRLSSSSLDLDLLDERARVVLNFARYDEFVVLDN
ncbi:MAG: septum formation initiator family protein [Alphaproteobacteria bacterium]